MKDSQLALAIYQSILGLFEASNTTGKKNRKSRY